MFFSFITINGFKIKAVHPDNICVLDNGNVMVVNKIVYKKLLSKYECDDTYAFKRQYF